MGGILSVIKQAGFEHILPCERVNLDYDRFTEYQDSNEHTADEPFERPVMEDSRRSVTEAQRTIPSIFRYFLDGSRRTYKVADVILDGRYLPLVAGQVGVAVVKRTLDGHAVEPMGEYCHFENILAFPDRVKQDLGHLTAQLGKTTMPQFRLVDYAVKPDRDPVDLGIAAVMKRMQDLEIEAIAALSGDNLLRGDSVLVVDGPLRFKEMKSRRFDLVQFRNVIGLSKSFRPSFTLGKKRKRIDVGSVTSALDFGERTSVFKTTEDNKTIGMWYLRIRPRQMMANPLDGVVKMECYAIDQEDKENGLSTDMIDVLSAHLLRERNVTPYKADSRWTTHIYPIYLAETYLKSSFMTDVRFKALF